MWSRLGAGACGAALLAAACTGYIEPTGSEEGVGDGVGPFPTAQGEPVGNGGPDGPDDPGVAPPPWKPGDALPEPGDEVPVDQKVPAPADPGGVRLRRLNRVEYNNSVRDLLGKMNRLVPDDCSSTASSYWVE